jgi:hypothetical protein
MRLLALLPWLVVPALSLAAEQSDDVSPGVPFREGDVTRYASIDKLRDCGVEPQYAETGSAIFPNERRA